MKRELRELLLDVARGQIGPTVSARAQAILDGKSAPRIRKKPEQLGSGYAHARTRRKLEETQETLALSEMRTDVWRWNLNWTASAAAPHGRCDNPDCQKPFRHFEDGDCDHWIERSVGGEHKRENGWRLCRDCHIDKNGPDRADWNRRRKMYCERARIPFVPRKEKP